MFNRNILVISKLLEYPKYSKKLRPAHFFEYFGKIYILLIINHLSLAKNFSLFTIDKKTLEVLNFHFKRKYHFVKLESDILVCFLSFMWIFSTDSFIEYIHIKFYLRTVESISINRIFTKKYGGEPVWLFSVHIL